MQKKWIYCKQILCSIQHNFTGRNRSFYLTFKNNHMITCYPFRLRCLFPLIASSSYRLIPCNLIFPFWLRWSSIYRHTIIIKNRSACKHLLKKSRLYRIYPLFHFGNLAKCSDFAENRLPSSYRPKNLHKQNQNICAKCYIDLCVQWVYNVRTKYFMGVPKNEKTVYFHRRKWRVQNLYFLS